MNSLRPLFRSTPRLFKPRFSSTSKPTPSDRLSRLLTRLPKPLQPYTSRLRSSPISHILSFLILHEITAILPLVGLAATFHYTNWLPEGWSEGTYIREGIERFGRYFRRKGWFGFDREHDVSEIELGGEDIRAVEERGGGNGMRILVEVATAYAVTKVLLPVRILFSVWATPWFARVVVGRFGGFLGVGRKGMGGVRSGAAGTGATGGGVIGNGKLGH